MFDYGKVLMGDNKSPILLSRLKMIPRHIAIIMDGNGRWARKRHLPRSLGHKAGCDSVKRAIKAAQELGVKILTIFAFSTENWSRPRQEIDALMNYLQLFLKLNLKSLNKRGIRLNVIGRPDNLSPSVRRVLDDGVKKTAKNSSFILNLALNYGSRCEIIDAVSSIARNIKKNSDFEIEKIDEKYFSGYLYTKDLPDPDLLIRTSGEQRLSNFLLWQMAYTELYFCKKLWPDFKKEDLEKAINEYEKRERRFGAV